jgi:hypothetical protein
MMHGLHEARSSYAPASLSPIHSLWQIPEWFPLSIIDGGTQAQGMLAQMKSDFGKKIFQNTLTRNIAGAIYKGVSASMSVEKTLDECVGSSKLHPAS